MTPTPDFQHPSALNTRGNTLRYIIPTTGRIFTDIQFPICYQIMEPIAGSKCDCPNAWCLQFGGGGGGVASQD